VKEGSEVSSSNFAKFSLPRWVLALLGAAIGLAAILAALQPGSRAFAEKTRVATVSAAPQSSFLYRFDPNTLGFFTRTLTTGSLPMDVAVTGTAPVQVWVTLAGTNKIGRLVYTSTSQTAWKEYAVTSTANSRPFQLALRGNEVWFTERGANRVGRLNALTGQIDEFFGNGLSSNSGLAGIDLAPDGSIWLAGQSSNRLIRMVVTSTLNYSFQEYAPGNANGPFAIAVESNSRIHFTAPVSDRVGFLTPSTGFVVLAPPVPSGYYPSDIVWDPSHAATWFSQPHGNRIGLFFVGTLGIPTQFGPITRPVGLSQVSSNTLWATQQDSLGQLAKLVYTPPSAVAVTSTPLPTVGLYPTGVALAADGSVWLAAYASERLSLPLLLKNSTP